MKEKIKKGHVEIDVEEMSSDRRGGSFTVVVYNWTNGPARHPVELHGNVPLVFHEGERPLNNGKPATDAQTRAITVPPGSSAWILVHWTDPDDGIKEVHVRASFMNRKSSDIVAML